VRLERGPYKLTILDTSQLTCADARDEFRRILREPGAELPEGWKFDAPSRVISRSDDTDQFRVEADDTEAAAGSEDEDNSFWGGLEGFALTWLPIIFMGLIALAVVWMVQYMPRTKPQEIAPSSSSSVRWDDVAGVEEAKDELREVVEFMRDPKRFKKLGAKVPKGILLHGPPGTGKTLLAKAVARESNAKFFAQSASSFVEMFAGLGAARIRRLFRQARKAAPAIVFIDELDAVGATRGNDISGEKDQTLNQLLVELDGFGGADNVVVIAASNLLEKLDPALLRPGRFDRQIFVSPPDVGGRAAILKVHTRGKPLGDVDLAMTARQTAGLTGADLANLANEAAIFAARAHRPRIEQQDFDAALERVVAGMQSRRTLNEHERRVVAFHEAGHAVCAELLPGVNRVHKISIVPRGRALGYTLNLPEEDRYLKTREELLDYMTVLLGGRAAEEIVFGAITTGASDDLKRVAEISRSMVHEYAMGTSITSLQVSSEGGAVSDRTRQLRDEEQQHLTDEAMRGAARLITEHRDKLDALAEALLRNEALERADIDRIMDGVPRLYRSPGHGLRVVAARRPPD
jgi:cell division protease FtsH